MKLFTTIILLILLSTAQAQWSNTNNQFYDSLHMPVCTALKSQLHPIVVQSYPDSGYFVIWGDFRNDPGNFNEKGVIYSQKYDKNGNQLWANNGVPVSAGTNNQHYTYGSNSDLRNYSVAATDSAGGFYITYADDSTTNYVWQRVMVQHMRSNGSAVFPGAGFIVFTSNSANWVVAPQLISDGNNGFFVGYSYGGGGVSDVYLYCYKDNNGTMQYYGGGQMNQNAFNQQQAGQCGNYFTAVTYGAYVSDYMIYSDLQKGCNVTMIMAQNRGGSERTYTGSNWLWRVKKDATAGSKNYKKDSVIMFSQLRISNSTLICGGGLNPVYTYAASRVESNGYVQTGNEVYGLEHTKAAVITTDGNINIDVMAVNERRLIGSVTDWFTHVFYRKQQKFDSIPYEFTVTPYYPNFTSQPPPNQNKLGSYSGNNNDTLLYEAGSSYFYDFNIASGGNKFFATGLMLNGYHDVALQQLQVQKITSDSFAVQLATNNKNGIVIGRENANIIYNKPLITLDNKGNALFYIHDQRGSVRVSPIGNGAELTWGAMGRRIGSGVYNGGNYLYYSMQTPFVALDLQDGVGVIAWSDNRSIPGNTAENIFMRHLDSLNLTNYSPPQKTVKLIPNVYGPTPAYPEILLGSSKRYSTIEALTNTGTPYLTNYATTPVTEILDNYYLGNVQVSVFQNTGAIRTYNSKPYLDRNYTIKSDSIPPGANINMRLFFTSTEFDAIKAANPSIADPGFLAVIKQATTATSAPVSYMPLVGDQIIIPISWSSVAGGYYIEIVTNSFGNFFIQGNFAGLWTGAVSTDWNTAGNWSDNNIPVATSNVTIPSSAVNMPLLAAATTINNLFLQLATTLNLNDKTFTNTGVISGSGSFTGSASSSLILSGAGSVLNFTQTSSSTKSLNNLTLNRGSNVTLVNALDIFGAISLTAATLNLNAKSVTLKSSAGNTARVANLTGSTLLNATNITAERYIPANTNRAWRLLAVPVITSQSINATWQNVQLPGVAGTSGIGTMITSNNGDSSFDFQTQGNSMQIYNSDANSWNALANTTSSIATDNGYMLFVRGDRTATPLNSLVSSTTLKTTGTLKQGDYPATPMSVQATKFELIGNPYASQIDFRKIIKNAGIDNTFYVWDPKLSGSYGFGAFQTLTLNGADYIITPGGGSYGTSGSVMNTIEFGQAFFVHATSTGNTSFTENAKTTGSNMVFRPGGTNVTNSLITNLFAVDAVGDNLADGTMVLFNNSYSNAVDGMDALKLTNFGVNLGMIRNGKTLSVEKRLPISTFDTIFFNLSNAKQQKYRFEFTTNALDGIGLSAWLIDKYLNTTTPVNLNGFTSAIFAVNADASSGVENRFSLVFSKPAVVYTKPAIVIYPNPVNNGIITLHFSNIPHGIYLIKLMNNLGQTILMRQINYTGGNIQTVNLTSAVEKAGVYLLEIIKPDNTKFSEKIILH